MLRLRASASERTADLDREMAPGQLSFEQMRDLYHFNEIDADTQVYGVLGDPIAHSFSPIIHNAAFRHEGLNCVYLPLRVPAEEFDATLQAFSALEIRGYSVTIPHKEAAARVAGYPDAAVQAIGAANTLYRDDRGRWYAANTDYEAALAAIRTGMAERGDDRLAGKKVLILMGGEFGRTPRISDDPDALNDGRDHWNDGFSWGFLSVNQPKFKSGAWGQTGPDGLFTQSSSSAGGMPGKLVDVCEMKDLGAFIYRALGFQIGNATYNIPLTTGMLPPVDPTNTLCGSVSKCRATVRAMVSAARRPSEPVQALAFPLLTIMARANPLRR